MTVINLPTAPEILCDERAAPAARTRHTGIVHVVDGLELGGLERVVTDLAIEQARCGSRVLVFSITGSGNFAAELEAAGVAVVVGGKRHAFDAGVIRALRRAVIDCDAGIVHTHNFVPNYYAAIALAWPTGARRVLVNTCHNMGSRLANRRLRWLYRLSLPRTARVAMVGAQVQEHFVGSGMVRAQRAQVLLNGIPTRRFADHPKARLAARATLGLAADTLLIGSVGRLVALKHHRLLLELMPALAGVELVLLGDGPLRADLEALADSLSIRGRVHFLGARGNVAQLLPALDVFALPSLTEGLSIALLEACASGLAIVATAVGGNPEIVSDGFTGLLVPPDDPEATRTALEVLLKDAALRGRLGNAAREWVGANASIEAMRRSHDRFYAAAGA